MEEIVSLGGKPFKVWYATFEDRERAMEEAQSMLKGNVKSLVLAASCPSQINRVVGDTVTLTATPTSGTPPYTYSFYKVLPGTTTQIWLLGTPTTGQSLNTYAFPLTTADLAIGSIKLKVGVVVFDSCASGSITSDEWCFVNVVPYCGIPVANLVVT